MEQQLRSALKGTQIKRVSGSDRYGTSTAVLKEFFSGQKIRRAFVATGIDYPDALSAAVPAGALNKRLVLSNGKCIPKPVVSSWIEGVGARVSNVYLVGGPAVLGQSVQSLTQCS